MNETETTPTIQQISIDPLSLSCVQLSLFSKNFNENKYEKYGDASGFIIKRDGNYYLITNWHVITGKNADSGETISDTGALPSLVRLFLIKSISASRIEWSLFDVSLETASWIEHPLGRMVDVLALPLPNLEDFYVQNLDLTLSQTDMLCYPAMPISIIGFPGGLKAGGFLPVWLTGYMASEPCINVEDKPLFYANVSGCEGLSGAPVIARAIGSYYDSQGNLHINKVQTKFIGIYSGRANDKTNVCRVWKADVVDELNWPKNQQEGR